MIEEHETLMRRWFEEVWNKKRVEAIDEMLAEDVINHGLGNADSKAVHGIEGFKTFHQTLVEVFPDIHVTVEDVVSDGEKVASRYSVSGTHSSDGLGVAPTNREIKFTGMGIGKIKNGKFVEVWNEVDFMKMFTQISDRQRDEE